MMSSLYVGASGMKAMSSGLSVVSNNLANQNTVGFQRSMMLYQDMVSTTVPASSNSITNMSQAGKGVMVGSVRTMFQNGGYEASNTATDMSITGKGFFPVTKDGKTFFSRAGNFRFTNEGLLVDPAGYALMGNKVVNGVTSGSREPIQLDLNNAEKNQNIIPPKATSNAIFISNLGSTDNKSADATDPYFSLAKNWKSTTDPALVEGAYNYSTGIKVYDSEGKAQLLTTYYDYAGEVNGNKVYEYIVTSAPGNDGREGFKGTDAAGMLMAGTAVFGSDGKLMDITAFVPKDPATISDLSTWGNADLDANGLPAVTMSFLRTDSTPQTVPPTPLVPPSTTPQTIGIDLGIKKPNGWSHAFNSPAEIGTDTQWVTDTVQGDVSKNSTTAYKGASSSSVSQNGYTTGYLSGIHMNNDGFMVAKYSNGQSQDIYRVALARFTSQDNLTHAGGNLFAASDRTGVTEYGFPGTENYGKLEGNSLETSNVDMSTEFTTMIITQRGFQMNSKMIGTSDQMIQKALELKR